MAHDAGVGGLQLGDGLKVLIDGPYGEPMIDIEGDRYLHVLLVAGGVGATFVNSYWASLQHQHRRGRPMKKVSGSGLLCSWFAGGTRCP